MNNANNKCPVCGNSILVVEKTCSHCGTVIEGGANQTDETEKMHELVLYLDDKCAFKRSLEFAKDWCSKHQVLVGVGEMALGASLISWGLHTGLLRLGADVVSDGGLIGGATGMAVGTIAGNIIGAIGIVPLGGIAIPAIAMIAGGAAIFGAFGYTAGDIAARFATHVGGFGDLLMDASALSVGLALLLDGARKIAKDASIQTMASMFKDGVIYLAKKSADGVACTWLEAQKQLNQLGYKGVLSAGATTAISMTAGYGLAASSVSVLGSHGIGALALSAGLISAPLWPVFACGAAGLAIWKLARRDSGSHPVAN